MACGAAGLLADYEAEGEAIEEVGDLQTVVDDDGLPVADIVVTDVRVVRLADVPWEFVEAENEGDASLAEWRAGHEAYWASVDCQVDDDTLLVLVWFELTQVHRDWPTPRVARDAVDISQPRALIHRRRRAHRIHDGCRARGAPRRVR